MHDISRVVTGLFSPPSGEPNFSKKSINMRFQGLKIFRIVREGPLSLEMSFGVEQLFGFAQNGLKPSSKHSLHPTTIKIS